MFSRSPMSRCFSTSMADFPDPGDRDHREIVRMRDVKMELRVVDEERLAGRTVSEAQSRSLATVIGPFEDVGQDGPEHASRRDEAAPVLDPGESSGAGELFGRKVVADGTDDAVEADPPNVNARIHRPEGRGIGGVAVPGFGGSAARIEGHASTDSRDRKRRDAGLGQDRTPLRLQEEVVAGVGLESEPAPGQASPRLPCPRGWHRGRRPRGTP